MDSVFHVFPRSEKVKPDTTGVNSSHGDCQNTVTGILRSGSLARAGGQCQRCLLMKRVLPDSGKNKGICAHYVVTFRPLIISLLLLLQSIQLCASYLLMIIKSHSVTGKPYNGFQTSGQLS